MENNPNTESFYYLRAAIQLLKKRWLIFSFSILFFVGSAYVLNWYLQPVYEVSSVIIIKYDPNKKSASTEEFMKSFSIFSATSDIQEEMLKMKSTELIHKALNKIHAQVEYFQNDGFRTKELYLDSPFIVEYDSNHFQPLDIKIKLIPKSDNTVEILIKKEDESEGLLDLYNFYTNQYKNVEPFSVYKVVKYGETIKTDFMSFRVVLNKDNLVHIKPGANYYFVFSDLNNAAYYYQGAVEIAQVAKEIQAAKITLKTKKQQKGIDFLNALTQAYLERNIEKQNQTAEKTIRYLDEQLGVIEDSLANAEENLQDFRSTNKIMNIHTQTDNTLRESYALAERKEGLETNIKYYNFIIENLEKNEASTTLLVPSSLGFNDAVLSGLIQEYIKLCTERNNLVSTSQTKSPYFNSLTIRINSQKNTLSENLKNLIKTSNIELDNIKRRLYQENSALSNLPGTERNLIRVERKYKLSDDNYNYMLRKRAEAQVAKASDMQSNDIVEPARLTQRTPVFPNKKVNLILGFFLGFVFPFAIFGIKGFFEDTISGEYDVKSITNYPSIGKVFHNTKKQKQDAILINEPRSAISESIRSIRSDLEYILHGNKHKVILLTSTVQGEGKSFNALNIAISLSLLERKTIIVDFDIRKQKKSFDLLDVENKLGLSSFLINQAKMDEIIVPTKIPFLDYIPAGPIPTNPAELATSEKSEWLINTLKEKYDYVIIDTPPIGLVKEALILMKYADLKIFVVRDKKTQKKELASCLQELENKKISNVYWLLNDVDIRHTIYSKSNGYYTYS